MEEHNVAHIADQIVELCWSRQTSDPSALSYSFIRDEMMSGLLEKPAMAAKAKQNMQLMKKTDGNKKIHAQKNS